MARSPRVVYDLDDTLLLTSEHKIQLFRQLGELTHVDLGRIKVAYEQSRDSKNGYHPYDHIDRLLNPSGRASIAAKQVIRGLYRDLNYFLVPGALESLEWSRENGWSQIMISLANAEFFEWKVMGAGIREYFDRLIAVLASKEVDYRNLNFQPDEVIVAVNDSTKELSLFGELYPHAKLVCVRGPKSSKVAHPNIEVVTDLVSLPNILKKHALEASVCAKC